jgi:serine/threonine-protein kinase
VYGVAAVIGVGAVVAAAVLMRPKDQPVAATPQPTAVIAPSAAPTVVPAKTVEPVPAVVPSAAPAALPAEVDLTVESTPKLVEIWQGTTKLGTSAAPLKVKRGDEKLKLTVKAVGFAPQEVEVTPSESQKVTVSLLKKAASGGSTKRGDLEF